MREAQRKFYETLEQPPTGLVSKAKAAAVPGAVETSPSERTPEAQGGYAEASPRRRRPGELPTNRHNIVLTSYIISYDII